ncbi:50S ribosomal protein L11 methyltransferase [Lunatimonas salinarum]|uniref:50S ribosomal protein L11 methyltransferase n=1 Tax=Lunatimonas salinarum TaxID=1774590 RepID=UPI001AE02812|nr:50S ribosomal protein L11 methyltransferase [Lunatimonas salinarum]
MDYLKYTISCTAAFGEILMAELAEIGFESFIESDAGIEAYVNESLFDAAAFEEVLTKYQKQEPLTYTTEKMPRVNWNEEWEKNYDPILVDEIIYVRASFHPKREDVEHEIIINPKMSFGTGHHATTYLMLKLLLETPVGGKRVLDAGSGTGILAIMAHRLGASQVEAFDIDDWCMENGNENFQINKIENVQMGLGTIRQVAPRGLFDVILANINKNVLMDEMEEYARLLRPGGKLLLSGFYEADITDLVMLAEQFNLKLQKQHTRNDWAALVLSY